MANQISNNQPTQSIEFFSNLVNDFFMKQVKKRESPLPIYTGCYSYKNKFLKTYDFICAKYKSCFSLMIALSYNQLNRTVTALDYFGAEGKQVCLNEDEYANLTHVVPKTPLKRWEFMRESEVLALYRLDENNWSTRFFKAIVIQIPYDFQNSLNSDNYLLDFGDGYRQYVPQKFVTHIYDKWMENLENVSLKDYLAK